MNKMIRIIQSYLIIGLPFVIALMIWNIIYSQNEILFHKSIITKILFYGLACNLMLWFFVLIIFLIMLVVMPSMRETTLRRLANLKERDEREEYITGKASRIVYISTISLTILFLFYSLFSVSIYKISKNQSNESKHQLTINVGIHFNLVDQSNANQKIQQFAGEKIFDSEDFELSKSAIMVILLCWQLLVFNIVARNLEKK